MVREGRRRSWTLRPRTVRSQVTWTATALVALMLVLSAFGLVAAQQRVLTHGIDEALIQRADNIERDVVHGTFGSRLPNEGRDPEDSFLQVVDAEGNVVAVTDNATGLPAATGPLPRGADQVLGTVQDVALSNGEFRVLARPVHGTTFGPVTLVVGKNLDDVNESVSILKRSLAFAIPIVTGLLALLVWWLTGRVLRPVESIRREVASIEGHELHRRVPARGSGDEIARLASTMNEMLGDTVELQKLVDDLLFLARSESGSLEVPHEPVDLDDLVLEEARRLRERGTVRVDVSAVSAARTWGSADQLTRAVRNLSSNAERHAAGCVTFELREVDGRSELVVADDGPGIAPEHRELVFTRFTRLDEARSRDAGGSGLGLAIVQDIVARHEGRVGVVEHPGPGARFVVDLPRAE